MNALNEMSEAELKGTIGGIAPVLFVAVAYKSLKVTVVAKGTGALATAAGAGGYVGYKVGKGSSDD